MTTSVHPEALIQTIKSLHTQIGVDPFLTSPADSAVWMADMFEEVFSGTRVDAATIIAPPIPLSNAEKRVPQLVMLSSITMTSMCEHHFVPFYGFVDIAYLPSDNIVGIGQFTQLVRVLMRRPQLQERLTHQIASHIQAALQPRGLAVHVIARHFCEAMRGNNEANQIFNTYMFDGELATDGPHRSAFLESISRSVR